MSELIQNFLIKKKISKVKFCKKVGCSPTMLFLILHGKNKNISITLFRDICIFTKINPKRLLADLLKDVEPHLKKRKRPQKKVYTIQELTAKDEMKDEFDIFLE